MKKNNKKQSVTIIRSENGKIVKGWEVNGKVYKISGEINNIDDYKREFLNTWKQMAKDQQNPELFKENYFNNIHTQMTEPEYRKKIKRQAEAPKGITEKLKANKKRIASFATAAVIAIAGIGVAYHTAKPDEATAQNKIEKSIEKEDNQALKAIYKKLLETKDGEQIVKQLQETDKYQESYNKKLAKYPDGNGNVLFVKAREVAAVQDISNANDYSFTSMDSNEMRLCDYIEFGTVSTKGLYVSEEQTGENTLIHDKDTKKEMKSEEDFAISAIKGNKSTSEIDSHFDELMKTGLTYTASGVNVAYLGEGSNIVISQNGFASAKLDEFINKAKTNNDGFNKLDKGAREYVISKKQRKLVEQTWQIMDEKNIEASLKSRDEFDMTTTEKGKRVHDGIMQVTGGYIIAGSNGTYKYVTSTKTVEVSRAEAVKQFGEAAVKKAEARADQAAGIPEKNKQGEKDKENLENKADNYEADYKLGQQDGFKGVAKRKNTAGYNAGYANGQLQKKASEEPDKVIKDETETDTRYDKEPSTEPTQNTQPTQNTESTKNTQPTQKTEPTKSTEPTQSTQSTESTRQKVEKIDSYETQQLEIELKDGTSYVTKIRVRA